MTKKYYLAHNWENRHAVRVIQKYLEDRYDIKFVNPFYDTPQAKNMIERDFLDVIEKYYGSGEAIKAYVVDRSLTPEQCKQFRQDDLRIIRKTDGMVCMLLETQRAIGSIKEIFYAHEIAKKPVYLICADKRFTEHMWHHIEVTRNFKTIMEFTKYLNRLGLMKK